MLKLQPVLNDSDRKRIYQSATELLEKVGFLCNHSETLEHLRQAGCRIGKEFDQPEAARQVLFTADIIDEALGKAPSKFTLYPTSPGYDEMKLNAGKTYVVPEVASTIWDYRTKETRRTTAHDLVVLARLRDACPNIDGGGDRILWLHDIVAEDDYDSFGILDISYPLYCLHNGKQMFDVFETGTRTELPTVVRTWQICAGGEEAFRKRPCGAYIVSPTSPYFLGGSLGADGPWDHADSLLLLAGAGAPIAIEPSGLLGASGPVTVPGLVTQTVAEWLAMNVAIQAVNPGNPVILKDLTGSCNMYAAGTVNYSNPEVNLLHVAQTEMAHYLDLPRWTSQSPMAVGPDIQMGWENMASLLIHWLAGTDVVSFAGVLNNYGCVDPRALVAVDEMASWVKHFTKGFTMGEGAIPLDLMMELGTAPFGGNFLGTEHTLKLYREAMWKPSKLTNSLARDAWIEAGGKSFLDRAGEVVEELLATHEPTVPESQSEQLRDLVAEILEREGIRGGQAQAIMKETYWS